MKCIDYNLPLCAYCHGDENLLDFECWLDEINNTICTGTWGTEIMPRSMSRQRWFMNWVNSNYMKDPRCKQYVIAVIKRYPELDKLLVLL